VCGVRNAQELRSLGVCDAAMFAGVENWSGFGEHGVGVFVLMNSFDEDRNAGWTDHVVRNHATRPATDSAGRVSSVTAARLCGDPRHRGRDYGL